MNNVHCTIINVSIKEEKKTKVKYIRFTSFNDRRETELILRLGWTQEREREGVCVGERVWEGSRCSLFVFVWEIPLLPFFLPPLPFGAYHGVLCFSGHLSHCMALHLVEESLHPFLFFLFFLLPHRGTLALCPPCRYLWRGGGREEDRGGQTQQSWTSCCCCCLFFPFFLFCRQWECMLWRGCLWHKEGDSLWLLLLFWRQLLQESILVVHIHFIKKKKEKKRKTR